MNAIIEELVPAMKSRTTRSAKRKILLMTDDPPMGWVLARMLANKDFLVLPITDWGQALKLARMTKFALALLDLNSPSEDDWEDLGRLAAQNPLLPVVLVNDHHSEHFHALASGVAALPEKPLRFVTLFNAINRLLEEPMENHPAGLLRQRTDDHCLQSGENFKRCGRR